jgi:hypothetical protein
VSARFPADLFTILVVPFIAFGLGIFLPALLIPTRVHHRLAVIVAVAIGIFTAAVVAVALVRRRQRRRR